MTAVERAVSKVSQSGHPLTAVGRAPLIAVERSVLTAVERGRIEALREAFERSRIKEVGSAWPIA